ncbi:MAG: hypothetical protein AB7I09_19605 [Planctomycetota bacterium]
MTRSSLLERVRVKTLHRILAILLLAAAGRELCADVVVLNNGSEIRGRVIAQDERNLVLEVAYGKMTVPRARVREVRTEDADEYLRKTGESLLVVRDYDKALDFLRQAHAQNAGSASCREALLDGLTRAAEAARLKHRYRETEALLKEARQLDPEHPNLLPIANALAEVATRRAQVELEAQQALETQDLAGAYRSLRWLCDHFPEERANWQRSVARLALSRAHLEFEDGRLALARGSYHEALALDPDLIPHAQEPLAFLEIKETVPLLEQGAFEAARTRLRSTHDLLPGNTAVLYHLALATEGCGDLSAAADLYAMLAGTDHRRIDGPRHLSELRAQAEFRMGAAPAVTAVATAPRAPVAATAQIEVLETPHFVVRHRQPTLAQEASRYLEHHYSRIVSAWFAGSAAMPLRHKIEIHLHPDRDAYRAASTAPEWSDGWSQTRKRYGLLVDQSIHLDTTAAQFLSATIPHELGHIILPHWFGAGVEIPLWIQEGIATSEEPEFKQRYFDRIVRDASADGTLVPLATLTRLTEYPDKAGVPILYAQSNSVVRFLRERLGTRGALALLRNLSSQADAGFSGSDFADVQELDRAWQRWLTERKGE